MVYNPVKPFNLSDEEKARCKKSAAKSKGNDTVADSLTAFACYDNEVGDPSNDDKIMNKSQLTLLCSQMVTFDAAVFEEPRVGAEEDDDAEGSRLY